MGLIQHVLTVAAAADGTGTAIEEFGGPAYLAGIAIDVDASQTGTLVTVLSEHSPGGPKTLLTHNGNADLPLSVPTEATIDPSGAARTWYTPPVVTGPIIVSITGGTQHAAAVRVVLILEV